MMDVKLNPKQFQAFTLLSDYGNGITELLYGGGARSGKALLLDESVCTPFGFRKVRDLHVGDIITSATTGGQQKIIKLHPVEEHEYYRVSFNDGTTVDCSEGHLWQVRVSRKATKRSYDYRIWETKSMYEWMERKAHGFNVNNSLLIPLCAPVQFTQGRMKERYIQPYMLGVLIGDGCLSHTLTDRGIVGFCSPDDFIVNRMTAMGYNMTHKAKKKDNKAYDYRIYDGDLVEKLKRLHLAGVLSDEKFIPHQYLYAPLKDRKELMQGLMDTDGTVDKQGHLSYTTVSKQLADDVAFLVRSFGGKATITTKQGKYNKDGETVLCKTAYNVNFNTSIDGEIISLPRKRNRCLINHYVCRNKAIVSITPIGMCVGRCITVDEPSGLFITDNFTVTHNSFLGCLWQITRRLALPGSVGLIARKEYARLVDTTIKTFFEVLNFLQLGDCGYYRNTSNGEESANSYYFPNGSMIYFRYLDHQASDPFYDRFGSYSLTDMFLDEAQEIDEKAISVLRGRFSLLRGKNIDGTDWVTIPKSLYTCNPKRNWIYNDFVKPAKDGTLKPYRAFVKALPKDNPHLEPAYLENLMRSDKVTVQRLVYGNFEYEDDPSILCDYDAILDCFTNDFIKPVGMHSGSADIAGKGHDRFVAGSWIGNVCYIREDMQYSPGKEVETRIKNMMIKDAIPRSLMVVDADGIGSFLESYLNGIKEFHGGGRPLDPRYDNLKSECGFKLAELINNHAIKIVCTADQRERIIDELSVLKQANLDDDVHRYSIIKKDEMKSLLGHSPDYLDMLIMSMYFRRQKPTAGAKMKIQVRQNN